MTPVTPDPPPTAVVQFICGRCTWTTAIHAGDDTVECPNCGPIGFSNCPYCKTVHQFRWAEAGLITRCSTCGRQSRLPRPIIHCPTCNGTSVQRVTATQRLVSGVAGGLLFGTKARAQFQCTACGYYW